MKHLLSILFIFVIGRSAVTAYRNPAATSLSRSPSVSEDDIAAYVNHYNQLQHPQSFLLAADLSKDVTDDETKSDEEKEKTLRDANADKTGSLPAAPTLDEEEIEEAAAEAAKEAAAKERPRQKLKKTKDEHEKSEEDEEEEDENEEKKSGGLLKGAMTGLKSVANVGAKFIPKLTGTSQQRSLSGLGSFANVQRPTTQRRATARLASAPVSTGFPGWAIALIVIGCIAVIALLLWLWFRSQRPQFPPAQIGGPPMAMH